MTFERAQLKATFLKALEMIDLTICLGDSELEAAAPPALEKFAKINHDWAENRLKVGYNFYKQ